MDTGFKFPSVIVAHDGVMQPGNLWFQGRDEEMHDVSTIAPSQLYQYDTGPDLWDIHLDAPEKQERPEPVPLPLELINRSRQLTEDECAMLSLWYERRASDPQEITNKEVKYMCNLFKISERLLRQWKVHKDLLVNAASIAKIPKTPCRPIAAFPPRNDAEPYECTSGCGSRFKTRDRWIRHEKQMFPQEGWVCNCYHLPRCKHCGEAKSSDKPCGHSKSSVPCNQRPLSNTIFLKKQNFKQHFEGLHYGEDIETYYKRNHFVISDTFRKRCGFCEESFSSFDDGIAHLEAHFTGRLRGGPKSMSDWRFVS